MNHSSPGDRPDLSRGAALLPLAYLAHLAEEWFGGFLRWTELALGSSIGAERFWWINGTAIVLFTLGTLGALWLPELRWFPAALAALLGLNGLLHAAATIGFGSYSPGVVTGLLLYVPLSFLVLRRAAVSLPRPVFVASVLSGILVHALVTAVALS